MDEARFVLKCFGFAAIVLMISQIKMKSGSTIEHQIQATLVSTEMSNFVNKAADGGVKLIKDGYAYAKTKMNKNNVRTKNQSTKDDNVTTVYETKNYYSENSVDMKSLEDQKAALQAQAFVFKQQAVKKIEELNEQIQTAVIRKKEKPILLEDELIEEIE